MRLKVLFISLLVGSSAIANTHPEKIDGYQKVCDTKNGGAIYLDTGGVIYLGTMSEDRHFMTVDKSDTERWQIPYIDSMGDKEPNGKPIITKTEFYGPRGYIYQAKITQINIASKQEIKEEGYYYVLQKIEFDFGSDPYIYQCKQPAPLF